MVEDIFGPKLFQQRARRLLPLLIKLAQAHKAKPITYGELGAKFGVHHRTFAYPLGSIGVTLNQLGEKWGQRVPPIQAIVVNKHQGIPGCGFSDFSRDPLPWENMSLTEKRELTTEVQNEIFKYRHWDKVAEALDVSP